MQLDQAKTLNNLAMLDKEEGSLDAAHQHAIEALQLLDSAPQKQNTATASILNSIGLIALAQKKFAEAKSSFEKASTIWIQTVGTGHPSYAATLSNLAMIESRQGHHKKAQQMFESALAIDNAAFGPAHPQVASNLTNIGAELFYQKDYQAASDRFERAEQINERCFGQDSVAVANLWRDMAMAYEGSKNLDASQAAYRKAIQSQKTVAGPEDANLSLWLREYAQVLRRRCQFGEAEQAEVEALRIEVRNTLRQNQKADAGGA